MKKIDFLILSLQIIVLLVSCAQKKYRNFFMRQQSVSDIMGTHFEVVQQAQNKQFQILNFFFTFFGNVQFLGLQKVGLKSTKSHETLFSWKATI